MPAELVFIPSMTDRIIITIFAFMTMCYGVLYMTIAMLGSIIIVIMESIMTCIIYCAKLCRNKIENIIYDK